MIKKKLYLIKRTWRSYLKTVPLIGYTDKNPKVNPEEVSDWKWEDLEFIKRDLIKNTGDYTVWFKIVFDEFIKYVKKNESNSK